MAKIAHNSLIGEFTEGGIRYKDINSFVLSLDMKFIARIDTRDNANSTCIPRCWILDMFTISLASADQRYCLNIFSNSINILDCRFKLPKKSHWEGHPYYWELLFSLERMLVENESYCLGPLLSTPIWFNHDLETVFNANMAKTGLNFVRDLYHRREWLITRENDRFGFVDRQVLSMYSRIELRKRSVIEQNSNVQLAIHPTQKINFKREITAVKDMTAQDHYKLCVSKKVQVPIGLLHWCSDLELSEREIRTALTFVPKCSKNVFDRMFQYKIMTGILPTNEYLHRYQVKTTNLCDHCHTERDTIIHRLYECEKIVLLVDSVLVKLREYYGLRSTITMNEYLFGKPGSEYLALNHILLELKKYVFYISEDCLSSPIFSDLFLTT